MSKLIDNPIRTSSTQRVYRFDNNYGASVIQSEYSYTDNDNEYELAVVYFPEKDSSHFELSYDTHITDDVLGHLEVEEVEAVLAEIKALK